MKHFRPLLALAALVPLVCLTACTDSDAPTPRQFCPNVAVLQQAAILTAFLPGRQDVPAEITTAQITGVAGSCNLNSSKKLLHISFKAGFSASNGPANTGRNLNLPYFVSISQGDTIIAKTNYTIPISFDGNVQNVSATSQTVTAEFPNIPSSATTEILVGFQLTPAELDYAQAHSGP